MTVTPRRPALSSPFESCLVCGLLLASEAGMQSGLPIQEVHLTTKFGGTASAAASGKVSDEPVTIPHGSATIWGRRIIARYREIY
jgi:hypothetical protein